MASPDDSIANIPKAELHVHLEGMLPPSLIRTSPYETRSPFPKLGHHSRNHPLGSVGRFICLPQLHFSLGCLLSCNVCAVDLSRLPRLCVGLSHKSPFPKHRTCRDELRSPRAHLVRDTVSYRDYVPASSHLESGTPGRY
ncbi:hypothetical protein K469DRAFT_776114 [Zopfia rhizophila CBS 207.26]|uniref:Adenosine deaminase domain-containing protein n=1 Tax=Zopfia rhizophila CBS 207.26 TaxID=1314779 RepID=A0A6A6E5Z5_9PEZI|nr:hypothetical protein K469DRAFT_776114 [Zopfia rhizophila CBS 207.26]